MSALRTELELPGAYPADAVRDAEAAVSSRQFPDADLTGVDFLTIDPESSTDLDQALFIERAGSGYRVLLAGMDRVTAGVGEFLRAGEPVGEMGGGPASVTLFGEVVQDGRPVLYIEFRNSSEAIDSGPWWIGGLKEARG